jgi:hypothetical protein
VKVRRQVDSMRRTVRLTLEFPLHTDPDAAADRAWEITEREMRRVQTRRPVAEGVAR